MARAGASLVLMATPWENTCPLKLKTLVLKTNIREMGLARCRAKCVDSEHVLRIRRDSPMAMPLSVCLG